MRTFEVEQDLKLLRAEEFVRTAARPVRGLPDVEVRFSGRLDRTYYCPNGRLVVVDAKTGRGPLPSVLTLVELPSTFLYTYLAHVLRQQPAISLACTQDVEIVQFAPHRGEWVATQLGTVQMEIAESPSRS